MGRAVALAHQVTVPARVRVTARGPLGRGDRRARIGSVSQVGDSPDPSIIIAALTRVAEEMASPVADAVSASPDVPLAVDLALASDLALADDFALAEDPFTSAAEALTSVPEPVTSDMPAGWDPIRVSTAWPAIRDTPPVADMPAGDTVPSRGIGKAAPWGAAPWATVPSDSDSPATSAADSAAPAADAASAAWASPDAVRPSVATGSAVGVGSGSGAPRRGPGSWCSPRSYSACSPCC